MLTLTNKSLSTCDVLRILGMRFRDYRLRLNMTRKEVAYASGVGLTSIYKFESGNMADISFSSLLRLIKTLGMPDNWEQLLPELPEDPYLITSNNSKRQRARH